MNKFPGASSPGGDELRRRAERCVRAIDSRRGQSEVDGGMQRVFHELQVHQIELELQNEELKQSKLEVEASLAKYTDLYDFAPVGYFTLDAKGVILEMNLTGAALLGSERSVLINRRFETRVTLESRPAFRALLERIFAKGDGQAVEIVLERTGRIAFWASLEAKVVCEARGRN
jgi:PAS domain S-box-containing protein